MKSFPEMCRLSPGANFASGAIGASRIHEMIVGAPANWAGERGWFCASELERPLYAHYSWWTRCAQQLLSELNMKMRRNLTLAALAAFVISHFLPAYSNSSGFACFAACWEMMLGKSGNGFSGGRFYYAGFAASNILFIGLAVALLARKRGSIPVTIVVMALLLHVLSWWVVHVLENPPQIDDIKIGYYVWLIAYGLLVAAHVWKVADGRSHPLPLESSPLNPT